MIDYYNELPQMVHIIDNMNQELADIQKKYEELLKKYRELEKISKVNCKYFWDLKSSDYLQNYSIQDNLTTNSLPFIFLRLLPSL